MKNALYALSLLYFGFNAVSQTPVRIACMGNSFTQGKIDKISKVIAQLICGPYLWDKLDSAGINADMVECTNLWFDESDPNMATTPVCQYTGHVFDRDRDSYYYGITSGGLLIRDASSSWTASTLPGLSDNLKTYTADIELLRIRTNDADNVVNKTTLNI